MSGFGVQDLIATLVALGAGAWLVLRAVRRRGRASGCEHCPSALAGQPACQAPPSDVLVTLDEPSASTPTSRRG